MDAEQGPKALAEAQERLRTYRPVIERLARQLARDGVVPGGEPLEERELVQKLLSVGVAQIEQAHAAHEPGGVFSHELASQALSVMALELVAPRVSALAAKYREPWMALDCSDFEQAAGSHVRHAIERWRPQDGSARGYLWRAIDRKMIDLCRKERSERRKRAQSKLVQPQAAEHTDWQPTLVERRGTQPMLDGFDALVEAMRADNALEDAGIDVARTVFWETRVRLDAVRDEHDVVVVPALTPEHKDLRKRTGHAIRAYLTQACDAAGHPVLALALTRIFSALWSRKYAEPFGELRATIRAAGHALVSDGVGPAWLRHLVTTLNDLNLL